MRKGQNWMCLWLFFLLLFIITSCSEKIVCEVGGVKITESDIRNRMRVSEVYYPKSGKEYVALAQLIKGYLSEEVLRKLGRRVDEGTIENESKRIDENTKTPDALKRIKDIYGKDRKGYLKTFVRIVYGERVLYNEIFLTSRDIHREQYEKAKKLLSATIKEPENFGKVAKDLELEVVRLEFEHRESAGVEQAKIIIERIKEMPPGAVYPEIIEWMEGYQVIRFINKKKDAYIVDSVSIAKRNYDEWFWGIAGKIPVKIYDKALKDKLLKEVGWAKNLNLK